MIQENRLGSFGPVNLGDVSDLTQAYDLIKILTS